ncbi:MAG: hypothetical protein QM802_11780 [Agriterribacter sp.]
MMEISEISVYYNECMLQLPTRLEKGSYRFTIFVEIDNQIVTFERDEDKNYRAIMNVTEKYIDIELIKAVILSIEMLLVKTA